MNTNIYNPYVREELYLMHHGILGQKWGKKNGPPYPLGASDHSASEKKAGWRKSLKEERKGEKRLKKYYNMNPSKQRKLERKLNEEHEDLRKARKEADEALEKDLKNWQKKHKREWEGDGGEFWELMRDDEQSETSKKDRLYEKKLNDYIKAGKTKINKLSDTDEIHKKYNKLFSKKVISKEDEKNLQKLYDNRLTPEDRKRLTEAADKIVKAWDMTDKADKMKFRTEKEKDDYYAKIDKVMQEGLSVSKDIAKNISKNDKYKTADHFFSGQKLNSSEVATQRTMSDIAHKKVDEKWIKKTGLTQSAYRSYERAAKEDKWNMEFLEMYQPEKWNKNEALAEYKKFLKDPDKWIERY